jgi:hypothetical protein
MSTVPLAPHPVTFGGVSRTSVNAFFLPKDDGGSPVLEWHLTYGSHPSIGQFIISSDGASAISDLYPRVTYYFWARGRNINGWSPWSTRSQVTTHDYPAAPKPVELSGSTQTSVRAIFAGNDTGGVAALEWQIGYGKNPTTPELFVSAYDTVITNLDPGKTYYFWARGRNVYGWGPWSGRTQVTLVAGAMVNDGGVWKRAVPYVRAGGVWKLARPWVKSAGVWKETPS